MATATLECVALEAELADGTRRLTVQLTIACPVCGLQTIRVAGHHLRQLRDALIEVIDAHPETTGRNEDVQIGRRWQGQSPAPRDPSEN